MKKAILYIISASVLLSVSFSLNAQVSGFGRGDKPSSYGNVPDTVSVTDSIPDYIPMTYDSLLANIGSSITVPDSLDIAMHKQVEKNRLRKTTGYRVRIYFDNSRDARSISEQIAEDFKVRYPDIPVFRIYDNPYFKVTVGEFLSKADAMRFMETIRREYPTVFLVKESFSTI